MTSLLRFLVLPREVTPFERAYLAKTNRVALAFFALHVPALGLLGLLNGTGAALALSLGLLVLAGPVLASATVAHPRAISVVHGVAAMAMGALLVHFGQGPTQIEMHFYFFALIAMLAVFGNPLVVVAAAATVAAHHLLLWFVLPRSVFNYDAPVWVVAVHAAFVALESVGAIYMARSFFDNVIGLESIVVARTAEVGRRQSDMRLVLDHVEQGLVMIDETGRMAGERTAWFDARFGREARDGETLFDVLGRTNEAYAGAARAAWEQVVDGFLPLEVALGQVPTTLTSGARTYSLSYRAIGDVPVPHGFLVCVVDVSDAHAAEKADAERRETMSLVEKVLSDRRAFLDFFEEASALVSGIVSEAPAQRRMLHTLKGNAGVFGLARVAELCHALEERDPIPRAELEGLARRWAALTADVERLVGAQRDAFQVDRPALDALERAVSLGRSHEEIGARVRDLRLEPLERRLETFAEHAASIARRLEKRVRVDVVCDAFRLDPRSWGPFLSTFVHAIRNTVDHGIESPAERVAAAKPAVGRIELRAQREERGLVLEISDDGRGIDWDRIATEAARKGLPTATEADLRAALFEGGISTARTVTPLSGRGVGMSAMLEATRALGGRISVASEHGLGTTLRFVFPEAA